ncbi:hypothetical protein FSP39_009266 [Pinctada imbricata]|uniref:Uncharacterized protein n=1 Tax=Pinctada imbricata TaxID=66713 RepID=A0AA88YMR1_PINIB|nr:hypothetical protein FSP39_009266 [Pinctada imbricata]
MRGMRDCTEGNIWMYKIITCIVCYDELFHFKEDLYYDYPKPRLVPRNGSLYYQSTDKFIPYIGNDDAMADVCKSLSSEKCDKWKNCCKAAMDCCERHQKMNISSSEHVGPRCPRGWDGLSCFMDTDNGTTAYSQCPSYMEYFDTNAYAVKTCHSNGSWYRHPYTGLTWTNYTTCTNIPEQSPLIYTGIITYSVSLVFLMSACSIFLLIKQLRCQQRIKIHFSFFLSLIMQSIMVIVLNKVVFEDHILKGKESIMSKNSAKCKVIVAFLHYATSATFFWMMCEALFLHRCVTIKAFKPPRNLGLFYCIGWGLPWVLVSVWIGIRESFESYNYKCWVHPTAGIRWIISAPQIICLFINLALLIHIFYFLTHGLQVQPNEPSKFRKILHASFMLIPLFGIPWILEIYRSSSDNVNYYTNLVSRIIQGSQVQTYLKQYFNKTCPDCLKRPKQRTFSISSVGTATYHVSQPATPIKNFPNESEGIPHEVFSFAPSKVRFSLQDENRESILPEMVPLNQTI